MFRVLIARTSQEIQKLRERWEEVTTTGGSIFQTFVWTQLAAVIFSAVEGPLVVSVESDSGLAFIPAALVSGGAALGFLGEALFDYRDVLHQGDEAVLQRAWGELSTLGLPLSVTALRGPEPSSGWTNFELTPFAAAPGVRRSQLSAEDFLTSHSRLGRQVRRLAKRGASLRRYDGSASQLIRWIYEQKAEQPQGGLFVDPTRREFMVRIAEAAPRSCEVFTYETVTQVVAALVTFRHRQTRHFYTIYFDQGWAALSPGQALLYEVTGISLAEGLDCDYMTGEQPYKTRLATHAVPLFTVNASADRLAEIATGSQSQVREIAA